MPTKPINLRLDTELLEYLEARATKEHRTLSNMIISILLDEKERTEHPITMNVTSTENATAVGVINGGLTIKR